MDEPENKVWHLFLVIDDEVSIQNIVEAYLKAEGNTVYLAEDGVQGLMLFRRYKFRHLRIDVQHHEVYRDNQPIDLTAREFSLLRLLATYPAWCLAANNCWNRSGATTIMAKTVWARAWRRFSRRQS